MEQFKKAFEAVKKAMDSKTMVDCGTGDTEPIWHFENEICRWLNGEPYRELDASGWEMYSSMSESKVQAKRLNKWMKELYDAFSGLKMTDLPSLKEFLNTKFWYKDV